MRPIDKDEVLLSLILARACMRVEKTPAEMLHCVDLLSGVLDECMGAVSADLPYAYGMSVGAIMAASTVTKDPFSVADARYAASAILAAMAWGSLPSAGMPEGYVYLAHIPPRGEGRAPALRDALYPSLDLLVRQAADAGWSADEIRDSVRDWTNTKDLTP